MFADMVGYSKHIEKDETANATNAARSIELFKALIGDYGGHVANIAGDGILALFDSADRALRFAIQIQTEFRDQEQARRFEDQRGCARHRSADRVRWVSGHCLPVVCRSASRPVPGIALGHGRNDADRGDRQVCR